MRLFIWRVEQDLIDFRFWCRPEGRKKQEVLMEEKVYVETQQKKCWLQRSEVWRRLSASGRSLSSVQSISPSVRPESHPDLHRGQWSAASLIVFRFVYTIPETFGQSRDRLQVAGWRCYAASANWTGPTGLAIAQAAGYWLPSWMLCLWTIWLIYPDVFISIQMNGFYV